MTLAIPISTEAEERLANKARAAGVDLRTFLARLLEVEANRQTLLEQSGEIFQNFKKSGMTDEELGAMLEAEKHSARAARRGVPFSE